MRATVLKVDRSSAVVKYTDKHGLLQAVVINVPPETRVGNVLEISDEGVRSGVEYGTDMSVVMKDIVITPNQIQEALRGHNLWTIDDIANNPSVVVRAVLSVAKVLATDLISNTKKCIEGG